MLEEFGLYGHEVVPDLAQHSLPYTVQAPHLRPCVLAIRDIGEGAGPAEAAVLNLRRDIADAFGDQTVPKPCSHTINVKT